MNVIQKFALAALLTMPLLGNAADLNISNETDFDLTFRINHVCSDAFGISPMHDIKIISEANLKNGCAANPSHCIATVYDHANCAGKKLGDFNIDVDHGMNATHSNAPVTPVDISGYGFNLVFYPHSR